MTPEQKEKLRILYQTQEELRRVKKLEKELRDEVVEMLTTEDDLGSNRSELSDRMDVVVTRGRTLTINIPAFADKEGMMKQRGLIGDNTVIVMKPSVSATAFKHLSEEDKLAFADVFEYKPSAPTVKFETRKER